MIDVAIISHIAGKNNINGLKLRLPRVKSFVSSEPSYKETFFLKQYFVLTRQTKINIKGNTTFLSQKQNKTKISHKIYFSS